jgi:N-acetylglucosamine kinase
MNEKGAKRRSSGWGNVLGDEGSAYYIGRRALAAACRAYDGRGPETALVNGLMEHLALDQFTDIVKKIYDEGQSPQEIASLAPLVSRLAEDADEVATAILEDAAEELALAVNTVIKGLDMQDEEFQVAASGSVFRAGKVMMLPFEKCVKSKAPRAEIVSPRFEPAMGAVFLALQEAGVELKEILG